MKFVALLSLGVLTACGTARPDAPVIDYSAQDQYFIKKYEEAVVESPVPAKIGKAYQVKDEWYFPNHEPSYDKTGKASWYGMEGGRTASGEILAEGDLTAAHPTLPIPSIVEVTNLDNGNVVNVRINDRGPFHSKRIIDVSRGAAKELGMIGAGTANVRVKLLPKETLEYLQYADK